MTNIKIVLGLLIGSITTPAMSTTYLYVADTDVTSLGQPLYHNKARVAFQTSAQESEVAGFYQITSAKADLDLYPSVLDNYGYVLGEGPKITYSGLLKFVPEHDWIGVAKNLYNPTTNRFAVLHDGDLDETSVRYIINNSNIGDLSLTIINYGAQVYPSLYVAQDHYRYNTFGSPSSTTVIAGTPGVPEPAAWLLMVAGFGLMGSAIRRRQALPDLLDGNFRSLLSRA